MVFYSSKTPDQMKKDRALKAATNIARAARILRKNGRKRGLAPEIKKHLAETADDMDALAKSVSPDLVVAE